MNLHLSTQIQLKYIPEQYYLPATAYDKSVISRYERIDTTILPTEEAVGKMIAGIVAQCIKEKNAKEEVCVLALSGGYSSQMVYSELVNMHRTQGLSFAGVHIFNVSEYYPLPGDARHTNIQMLRQMLIDHIDIKECNIHTPLSTIHKDEIYSFARNYEEEINRLGGIDIALLGIGLVGNIAYNEPGAQPNSGTRLVLLDNESRKSISRLYSSIEATPNSAITMGIGTLMRARQVILCSVGEHKAYITKQAIEKEQNIQVPASILQLHPNARAVVDFAAGDLLTRINYPWLVTSCKWDDKLIRHAIVWLCQRTKKTILKLTNKDYTEHGLGELLSLYGSAYNVNIKIFNDLQHTITGWPGGKPDADDTNRPERATPYPKKVIVFSPHPDDDVISMGGTLRRLVDQHHDVHVAYETSGNIAVGDEEVLRFIGLMIEVAKYYVPQDNELLRHCRTALHFLMHDKREGDKDIPEILFLKGYMRRQEALSAGRHIGLKVDNIAFLDLPFYETGTVKKSDLTQKDIDIVKNYILKIKPDQLFLAGDLADPHGTHRVCLDAVLAAIDELKNEPWMQACTIWMYRGAWAEWEIENIEMAVPISPEELLKKRYSILRHASQMESAPFLGNDDRLFWQRAEERNRATAELYHQLGLASYEAIEAFVKYHIK